MSNKYLSKYIQEDGIIGIISKYLSGKLNKIVKENIIYDMCWGFNNRSKTHELAEEYYETVITTKKYKYIYTYFTNANPTSIRYNKNKYIFHAHMKINGFEDNIYIDYNKKEIIKNNNGSKKIQIKCYDCEPKYKNCRKNNNEE